MGDKCRRQVGDKGEPKARRVGHKAAQGTQSGRQVWGTGMGDKCETSVNSCSPRNPEWKTRGETSVNSCGPRHPEWETRGRHGGDKCKPMQPKEPRVGDKCGRQVGDKWATSGRHVGDKKLMRPKAPRVGDKEETSVNSCTPSYPEWETTGRQV